MDAGHEARLLANAATLGSAQALGVPATPLTGDIRGVASAKEPIAGVVAKGGNFRATARALANMANENAASWMRAIVEAGAGCDAILAAGLASFVGLSAAEYLGVKGVGCVMIPITPTAAFPSPFLPPKWVPRAQSREPHFRQRRPVAGVPRQDQRCARPVQTAAAQEDVDRSPDDLRRLA
jgi:sterol 3beta-glucosyltransferase